MTAERTATTNSGSSGIQAVLPAVRRSTMATPPDLAARRAAVGTMPRPSPIPGIDISDIRYADVPCVVCTPPEPRGVLVYFHGGGYRLGSAAQFTHFATRLAGATGARVVVVDFRLAPEHPYPAALHDATSVYEQLLTESGVPPIAIGDSAGGGLAAALVVTCIDAEVAVPRGLVLMSPWLDLRCVADSYHSRAATDQLFSHDAARQAADQYLQGHHADDPLASPLIADVAAFPPALLFASTDEVLLDDTVTMASGLARAGVPTTTHFTPGVPHAWPSVHPDRPESAAALDVIARFVRPLATEETT
ncbi:alpha/beta hydrolase [Streptomyces sp. PSKA54]|uniref:Alpha/beta hydrolase n=1 Tax=Streptomyces himalayensis subsp. aureolus TaxID=2758039 RepID=A0A7W2D349_9ACTN|nr:alpha/beta hydrolase [Streptomyces himalayensis]MBA4863590.1 alpha/beta hydrolase [Streptomyces himalayensis subsp. aureolus]